MQQRILECLIPLLINNQLLKMTYHLLYGMNKFLPNMGAKNDHVCESL